MCFDPETAFLRRICLRHVEVIRGIYGAVRDRNWCTVPPQVRMLELSQGVNSFQIRFEAVCRRENIHFRWLGSVSGAGDGTVTFEFHGEALTGFLRNRIGLCVLHPPRECVGTPVRFETAEGDAAISRFPELIEPQIIERPRFHDLRVLSHEIRPGVWAELRFEGDRFELEDQRNWTDASFKTYSTPLACRTPVEIPAGAVVHQRVVLRLRNDSGGAPLALEPRFTDSIEDPNPELGGKEEPLELFVPGEPTGALPQLGLGAASHQRPLSSGEIAALSALRLSHLRVDLWLDDEGWPALLNQAVWEASHLSAAVEAAVHVPPNARPDALQRLAESLRKTNARFSRLLILDVEETATQPGTLKAARLHLGGLGIPIGGGTDLHFCELNREHALGRFRSAETDFVSWPVTPQVHACDHLSLIENLEAQPDTVATARARFPGKPVAISPVTLRPRPNPPIRHPVDPAPPPNFDPRQLSWFGGAWTLGSLLALAGAGVESVTFFEMTGGLVVGTDGSPNRPPPASDASSLLVVTFPVYHVFAALAGLSRYAPLKIKGCGPDHPLRPAVPIGALPKSNLIPGHPPGPPLVVGLRLFTQSRSSRVLVGSLSAKPIGLRVYLPVAEATLTPLFHSAAVAATEPRLLKQPAASQTTRQFGLELALQPFEVVQLEF
jgi:hypothetical protein